ncbi:MAG: hypothetical protein M1483_04830 [Actinobacteria bacterium]|jgi:hypothetical protein|nr:hypothetical protein [Actinomycetota bacterium]MCL6104938.1 hypothetical protein [Actinomycetota bacterium]
MKSKWASGIKPHNFVWIFQGSLAVCERPGGVREVHRKVRRTEELIWIKREGFTRIVSLLVSPHNLTAYGELSLYYSHIPLLSSGDVSETLTVLYTRLDRWLSAKEKVLLHQEEVSDRVMGVVAGYLLWSKKIKDAPEATVVIERIVGRPMGFRGRELVAMMSDVIA